MGTVESEPTGPLTQQFDLLAFTNSLIQDLKDLREGKISVRDAQARALIAKHVLRSIHYVVMAQKFIEQKAIPVAKGAP